MNLSSDLYFLGNIYSYFMPPYVTFGEMMRSSLPNSWHAKFNQHEASNFAPDVSEVATRILNQELKEPTNRHHDRIKDMFDYLPDSSFGKDTKALVEQRLKILKSQDPKLTPTYYDGTDSGNGFYYISINEDIKDKGIPFITAHHISRILGDDHLLVREITFVASLAISLVSYFYFDQPWYYVGGAQIVGISLVNHLSHSAMTKGADDFAIKHCTTEELEGAIEYLEDVKEKRQKGYFKLLSFISFDPVSEDERISKIRKALLEREKVA